jgi:hypothetical protein
VSREILGLRGNVWGISGLISVVVSFSPPSDLKGASS